MRKILLTLICLIATAYSAFSQISYSDSIFAIDRVPCEWKRSAGFYMTGYDGFSLISPSTWLKMDLTNTYPSISGSNGFVNLYDADNGTYSTLFVECIYNRSDIRAKTEISDLSESRIDQLRPVSFKWKATNNELPDDAVDLTVGQKYGFIAQEIQQVYPELVRYDDYGNLTVNYIGLIPVLIKSLQEIESDIERQTSEIDLLTQELSLLKESSTTSNLQQ